MSSSLDKGAWPHLRQKNTCPPSEKECTLLLEEAKGHAVFWNGSDSVPKLVWKLNSNDLKITFLKTISEVLEKFVAQDFLRQCNVSLATPEPIKNTSGAPIRMSDPFGSLWKDPKSKVIKLIFDPANQPDPSKFSNNYVLILSEMNHKRVLWDGRYPSLRPTMIARVDEYQMLTSIETVLKKYMPLDYLRKGTMKLQLIQNKMSREITREIKLDDLLGALFKDKSASLRFWHDSSNSSQPLNGNDPESTGSSSSKINETRSVESFWLHGNWHEIREKVQYLLEALESHQSQKDIPEEFNQRLHLEKSNLETSMRRRSRSIEEVWSRYETLKDSVNFVAEEYKYKSPGSTTVITEPPRANVNRDALPPSESCDNLPRIRSTTTSAIDVVAHHFRSMGVDIYDEDDRVSPAAGVAFTLAVVVFVCVLAHYM